MYCSRTWDEKKEWRKNGIFHAPFAKQETQFCFLLYFFFAIYTCYLHCFCCIHVMRDGWYFCFHLIKRLIASVPNNKDNLHTDLSVIRWAGRVWVMSIQQIAVVICLSFAHQTLHLQQSVAITYLVMMFLSVVVMFCGDNSFTLYIIL